MDPLRDVNRREWEREETWCALGEMQGRGKAQRRGRRIAVRTATRICTTIGAEILMTRGYSHERIAADSVSIGNGKFTMEADFDCTSSTTGASYRASGAQSAAFPSLLQ